MDFTLGDALWAVGIVLAAAAVGVVATVFFALGGADLLRGAGRSIGRAVAQRVNHFEPAQEPRPAPRPERPHMSSQRPAPKHRIVAVPGEGLPKIGPPVPPPDLTEDRVFRETVLLKNKQGGWRHSGKRLYSFWGGNHDEFLAKVRALREGDGVDESPADSDDIILTPIAQRPTRQSYYADPELVYRAPDDA